MGKNQKNLLEFLKKYPNRWHSFNPKDRATRNAVESLRKEGILVVYFDQMYYAIY
jgi:hypothetical protein